MRSAPIALLLVLSLPFMALAETLEFSWKNSTSFQERHGQSAFSTEVTGMPSMPLDALNFAIPEGMRVSAVTLADVELSSSQLEESLPRFEFMLGSEGSRASISAYTDGRFPNEHLVSWNTASYRGIRWAEILLAPWLWDRNDTNETLTQLSSARIILELEVDPQALSPLRQRPESWNKALERVATQVINPQDLNSYAPRPMLAKEEGLFQPRAMPSIEGSGADMLIVCSAELESIFQDFADYKTSVGVLSVVRNMDWILANYPQGVDPQETLRMFITDAYVKWGIEFILLAGDSQVIPARYALSHFIYPPALLPSDLYYAALDGDWNGDGDEYFGESTYGGADGDDVDLVAELFIGRIPVTDAASAELLIEKIITYSETPDLNYVTEATFLGEVLFPAHWQRGDPIESITRNGADYCETVIDEYLPAWMTPRRLYETYELYPGSEPELVQTVIDDLNDRAHFVHHVGHGFRYNMSVGEGNFMIEDAMAMSNGFDHLIQTYAMNCTSCAFDYTCLGEAFLLAENGGGLTTIGSVREAFPQTAVYYQDSYWESVFADSSSIGESFTYSHNKYSHLAQIEGSHRWTQLAGVLFGDPSVELWIDNPDTLELALTETFTLSSDTLKVYVSHESSPLENAKVIAQKTGEDRAVGFTDAAGLLELPIHADSPGSMEIHVLANNMLPLHTEITVDPASGPRLSISGLDVLDDPGLDVDIAGNADGSADAGESLRLHFWILNAGDVAADSVSITLSAPGGELTLNEFSIDTEMLIAAGDSLELDLAFLAFAPFNLPNRSNVILNFEFDFVGGSQSDELDLQFTAPVPRLFAFSLDDSSGDGDGELDAGEIASWVPQWKNYGNTPSAGWTATLSALDPEGSVLGGPVSLPTLGLLEEGSSASIDISESDVSLPHEFQLLLEGPLGEEVYDTLSVRRPVAPTTLFLDSSFQPTIIDVVWEEPDTNAVSYLVYRSQEAGGPYTQASSEPVHFTVFRNDGLEESSEYFFVVETLNASGFRSGPSAEFSISTNPTTQSGWPSDTNLGTASSLAIGDIDGDGDNEVVAGSNRLYAWHHDGAEVRDGDNDSGTYGVFTDDGDRYTASIAMADIDPTQPGLEIVSASRNTQEIFVTNGLGEQLPGFPKYQSMWTWATPAVADVDNDGFMEIFTMCLNGNLYAWNHDGTPLLADPDGIFAAGLGSWTKSSPTLGQMDADPELEICIGTNWGVVWIWDHDGSVKPGYPLGVGDAVNSSISMGDLDGDGENEIVFLADSDRLYAQNANGSSHAVNFPITLVCNPGGLAPSPVLVDFEDDGEMEIVAVSVSSYHSMDVVVYDQQGNLLDGWPVHLAESSESSPVVVDLDHDRELEILLGTEQGYLHGWEMDGTTISGFPILAEAELRSSPTVADLDNDLDVEVALMGWDSFVYIWDMPGGYFNGLAQWKMFRANNARTGVFTREEQVTDAEEIVVPAGGFLYSNYPNPFNPKTEIRFVTPAGTGSAQVSLAIYDIQGRQVTLLFEGGLTRGQEHRFSWEGKDRSGNAVSSGVYFTKVKMDDTVQTRKMMLLK